MKKLLALSLLILPLLSCAHGRTDNFPTLDNPAENAKVYVFRDNNLMGWGFSLKVVLDDSVIARLRSGEYVDFYVKPGFHTVGVNQSAHSFPFEKGHTYYFLISADYTQFGFELDRINDRQGEYWLERTKPLA
jgi:hypothetical protein